MSFQVDVATIFVGANVEVLQAVVLELARRVVLSTARGWTEGEIERASLELTQRVVQSHVALLQPAQPASSAP